MSEHQPHEHTSFIKTPKQLIAVVILSFVVPVVLIAIVASLAMRGHEPSKAADADVAKRLKPVGQVVVAEGSDVPGQQTGKQIVEAVCSACHATGALNAPKMGDKAAWAPLIAEGHAQLTEHAIKGIRQMPPRGGNPQLTDAEVARAVAYMANQAGASFTEPPVQQTAAAAGGAGAPVAAAAAAPAAAAAAPAAGATAAPAGGAAGAGAGGGKAIVEATCNVCHGAGVAGAPKIGDKAAWAPRIAQGMPTLYEHALKGKGAMPPKGGNMALSDADVKSAVDFMASQSK